MFSSYVMTKSFLLSLVFASCVATSVPSAATSNALEDDGQFPKIRALQPSPLTTTNKKSPSTKSPTRRPTMRPTTFSPTNMPTNLPTLSPTNMPTNMPTKACVSFFDEVSLPVTTTFTVEVPKDIAYPGNSQVTYPGCVNPLLGPPPKLPPYTPADEAAYKAYLCCLEQKYAIQGKWWFHRDDPVDATFTFKKKTDALAFTKDAVCSKIGSNDAYTPPPPTGGTGGAGKAQVELWDSDILFRRAYEFLKFEVDYNVVVPNPPGGGGTTAFVTVYMKNPSRTPSPNSFFDCSMGFSVPTPITENQWKKLVIDKNTVSDNVRSRPPTSGSCGAGVNTIQKFIDFTGGEALLGVNNGELYSFVLVTGSTAQDNSNLEVCWSQPTLTFGWTSSPSDIVRDQYVHQFTPV